MLNDFLTLLKQSANSHRAIWDKNYHKSSREHWGVTAAKCDATIAIISKKYDNYQLMQLAEELWHTNIFDAMIAATRILSLKKVTPNAELWQIINKFMLDIDGWALEDNLAHAARKCIIANENLLGELAGWTKHKNFWIRRAALIFTLPYTKKGRNPELMLKWAGDYADDSEWFIQKAIGWWLRELSKHNPERVIMFLEQHSHKLKNFAKKEASRKIDNRHK